MLICEYGTDFNRFPSVQILAKLPSVSLRNINLFIISAYQVKRDCLGGLVSDYNAALIMIKTVIMMIMLMKIIQERLYPHEVRFFVLFNILTCETGATVCSQCKIFCEALNKDVNVYGIDCQKFDETDL